MAKNKKVPNHPANAIVILHHDANSLACKLHVSVDKAYIRIDKYDVNIHNKHIKGAMQSIDKLKALDAKFMNFPVFIRSPEGTWHEIVDDASLVSYMLR